MSICKDCLHNEVCKYGENRSNGMYCTGEKCKQYKPTADVVEVRHGEWETIPDCQPNRLLAYRHICSECKNTYKDLNCHGHNYCHWCGAKMDGERREGNEGQVD